MANHKECVGCIYLKEFGCLVHRIPKSCHYVNVVFKEQKEAYGKPIKPYIVREEE